jgi:hypothetical protein
MSLFRFAHSPGHNCSSRDGGRKAVYLDFADIDFRILVLRVYSVAIRAATVGKGKVSLTRLVTVLVLEMDFRPDSQN